MITLSVPGSLEYRDVAVRVVGAACKLFGPPKRDDRRASEPVAAVAPEEKARGELADAFVMAVVSAFSEAFNNLALHGYRGVTDKSALGRIDIKVYAQPIDDESGAVVIEVTDTGHAFDPAQYLELPDELPERGMGLFIIRSFMDEIRYEKGPPHTLTLVKRWSLASSTAAASP
ncbi:MAG: ATP-binding protein [Polyangiaceae bacterium]|nr:ATP-binding protein [Polyangiaceae bacterium]